MVIMVAFNKGIATWRVGIDIALFSPQLQQSLNPEVYVPIISVTTL